MNIKKLIYPVAVILLITAFNLSLFVAIKNKQDLSISVGILILMLALVVFRNRTFNFKGNSNQIISLALGGVAITIVNVMVGLAYAIVGLLFLVATQLRIISNGNPIWFFTGGNPLHKLDEQESKIAGIGLAMILSVALTFFIKVVWLANTV